MILLAACKFSFAQARMDYTLWLDADDVLLPSDRQKLLVLKAQLDGTADVVMLPYHTGFDEQADRRFFCYRERLLKNVRATSDGRVRSMSASRRAGISGTETRR